MLSWLIRRRLAAFEARYCYDVSCGRRGGDVNQNGSRVMADQLEEFERQRTYLRGLAYRMTGSLADAEDAAQDAYLRWTAVDAEVRHPRAYLSQPDRARWPNLNNFNRFGFVCRKPRFVCRKPRFVCRKPRFVRRPTAFVRRAIEFVAAFLAFVRRATEFVAAFLAFVRALSPFASSPKRIASAQKRFAGPSSKFARRHWCFTSTGARFGHR